MTRYIYVTCPECQRRRPAFVPHGHDESLVKITKHERCPGSYTLVDHPLGRPAGSNREWRIWSAQHREVRLYEWIRRADRARLRDGQQPLRGGQ